MVAHQASAAGRTRTRMLEIGQKVEKYVLESLVGEGGMARVYAVRHTILGSRHALKVLSSELLTRPGLRERFLAEGRILAQLSHPNLVAVTDVVVEPGVAGLIQELLVGQSLAERLEQSGPMPVGQIVDYLEPVLEAVAHVHDAGIVHRDLKPSNIFLHERADGSIRPVVLDFGIARLMSGAEVDHGRKRQTRTGATLGTAHYMSPEQLQAPQSVDHRTDIFSLGAVLFEMVTGRVAFDGDTEFVVMQQIAAGSFDLELIQRSPASNLAGVVAKALAQDPGDRYPDCRAFTDGLLRAAGGARFRVPTRRSQGEADSHPEGGGGRGLSLAVVASVAVSLVLCVVISVLLIGRSGPESSAPAATAARTQETAAPPVVRSPGRTATPTPTPAPARRSARSTPTPRPVAVSTPTPTPRPVVRVEPSTPAPTRSTRGRSMADLVALARRGSPLPESSLRNRSCDELWSLRNWVYARHGYAFTTSRARTYYGAQSGYQRNSRVTSATVSNYLTPTDLTNRDRVVEAERATRCR